jgi:hypothetical protein
MSDTRPIWEGPVGNTGWTTIIKPIGDNMNRGILHIYDPEGEERHKQEVPVSRMEPLGGTQKEMSEWYRVVRTWFRDYS